MERILEYHQLPQEKAREIVDKSPPPAWPTEGVIQYQDVWMRYREGLDPVLKVQHPGLSDLPDHDFFSIIFTNVSICVWKGVAEVALIVMLCCICIEAQVTSVSCSTEAWRNHRMTIDSAGA